MTLYLIPASPSAAFLAGRFITMDDGSRSAIGSNVCPVRLLSRLDVASLLTHDRCAFLVEEALRLYSGGQVIQPPRMAILPLSVEGGLLGLMPAVVTGRVCSLKAITVVHHATQSHQGVLMLFDASVGALRVIMDASEVTAIRTAACSAVATKYLMRTDLPSVECAILGTGVQANAHMAALQALLRGKICSVRVWGRSERRARDLADVWTKNFPGVHITVCGSPQLAVEGADVVCTTTSSTEPIVKGEWLKPGAHVNAVGSCTPHARELDSSVLQLARVWVDSREMALREAGDICLPLAAGEIDESTVIGELGDVILGRVGGRDTAEEISLFKSVGLAIEDAVVGEDVLRRAEESNVGTTFAF